MKLIDLFLIPLPGHSNRSPEPPNKFAALAAMKNPPISGWVRYLHFQQAANTISTLRKGVEINPGALKCIVEAIMTLTSSDFDKTSPMLNDGNGGSNTAEFKFGKCPGR